MKGLIYLPSPGTTRPPAGSVIVVTVKRISSSSPAGGGSGGGEGTTLLAAAQFPLTSAGGKLPVRFQFTKDNFERRRVSSKQELDTILDNEDLFVEATCCPSVEYIDRNTAACLPFVKSPILDKNQDKDDDDEDDEKVQEIEASTTAPVRPLSGSGIAKLLRLPGKDGGDSRNSVVAIRAAVSLPLHY
jgi:hypothetical protein